MTFYKILIGAGVLAMLALIAFPFLDFPALSTSTEFLASYGAYLSGTLGPLISALAFAALLKTLHVQQEQLKHSELESQKNSLQVVLSKSEENLEKDLMRHNLTVKFKDRNYEHRDLLLLDFFNFTYKDHLLKKSDPCKGNDEWVAIMGQEIMMKADINLLLLAAIVQRYDKLCSEDTMYQYYSTKYFVLIKRLDSLEYLSEDNQKFWKNP
ncbi:hypothetical protein GCM10023116_13170 [Kistimonas scapharcae]|uniref:Phage abortive infection protein n=1 Tax=Kistimonas scapharcae TaxID=1036133 RepID=A0ABP8V0T5_9GAMM